MIQSRPITRLAPSPTGALHLGNARTFLVNWLMARLNGWRIVLRIEDIDGPRIKHNADRELIEDLRWLGIDWDDGPVYQSARRERYEAAIARLCDTRAAYPCICSRREVERAASAPHAEDGSTIYPGTCRGRFESVEAARLSAGKPPAIRFRVPDDATIEFVDGFTGRHAYDVASQLGDFVIAKSDGTPAYQVAVVVDDADMAVTHVVRGDDLLDSTPRQILIYRALGLADRVPTYYHLPLVTGPDGRRLAKRHGDTRLAHYRSVGVTPGRILALLARWSGMGNASPERPSDLLRDFSIAQLPREPVIFTDQDDTWLRADKRT